MTELYKVTIKQELDVNRIDGEGKRTYHSKQSEYTVQDYVNCTWDQIQFYRKKYPTADITIQQTAGFQDAKPRVSFRDTQSRRTKVDASKFDGKATRVEKALTPAPDGGTTLGGGTYADVVNKMMEEAK